MRLKLLFIVFILFFSVTLPASASTCRHYKGHQICILSIKRSAKNYWEYRAVVSVDGEKKPLEIYNCRQNQKVQADGTVVSFAHNSVGKFICNYFKT